MLHRTLEQYCSSQSKHVRSHTPASARSIIRIIIFIQCTAAKVHTTHRITDKRMQAGIECLSVTASLREMQVFTRQYCFTRRIVRIHTFPAARQSTSVENHQQPVFIGISKNIFIELHGNLLVTAKEVNLYATYSNTLHPFHFFTTGYRIVHNATG